MLVMDSSSRNSNSNKQFDTRLIERFHQFSTICISLQSNVNAISPIRLIRFCRIEFLVIKIIISYVAHEIESPEDDERYDNWVHHEFGQ